MQALSNPSTITKQDVDTVIYDLESGLTSAPFAGARIMGVVACLLSLFVFAPDVGLLIGIFALIAWGCTWLCWSDGKRVQSELRSNRAQTVWQELIARDHFGLTNSFRTQYITKDVAKIYEIDPQGDVLPLSQAVRLVLVWSQQQQRLNLLAVQVNKMQSIRETLLEKQRLLRELDDYNEGLERTVAQLNSDLGPLEHNHNLLKASCIRLESILSSVEAAARRRQIHREVGQLTVQYSFTPSQGHELELADEHLDLERQITHEIDTFLQLERETDRHLRDV